MDCKRDNNRRELSPLFVLLLLIGSLVKAIMRLKNNNMHNNNNTPLFVGVKHRTDPPTVIKKGPKERSQNKSLFVKEKMSLTKHRFFGIVGYPVAPPLLPDTMVMRLSTAEWRSYERPYGVRQTLGTR
jgi:hypothetical protein